MQERGLPSILSARMGAKAVTLTDYDPKVLTFRGLDSVTHVPITILCWYLYEHARSR